MTFSRGINTTPKNRYNVPAQKIEKMTETVNRVLDGDRVAMAQFTEAISTSDAPLALAHVINSAVLPQYDTRAGIWNQFATRKVTPSFKNISFFDIVGDFDKLAHAGNEDDRPGGVLPVVPELTPYPEVALISHEIAAQQNKRGVRFAFSWEAHKEDPYGFLAEFPTTLADLVVDTEDWTATQALETVTAYSQLVAGTAGDGSAVPANAPLSLDALALAMSQVRGRQVNGRRVTVNEFVLVVPPELALKAQYLRNLTNLTVTDGSKTYDVGGFNPVGNLDIVENPYLSGSESWYLVPKPGAARRIAVAQLFLAGEEAPELRVNGLQGGNYPGGGDVSWDKGSFINDDIEFRLRSVGGSALVDESAIVWSDGSGS